MQRSQNLRCFPARVLTIAHVRLCQTGLPICTWVWFHPWEACGETFLAEARTISIHVLFSNFRRANLLQSQQHGVPGKASQKEWDAPHHYCPSFKHQWEIHLIQAAKAARNPATRKLDIKTSTSGSESTISSPLASDALNKLSVSASGPLSSGVPRLTARMPPIDLGLPIADASEPELGSSTSAKVVACEMQAKTRSRMCVADLARSPHTSENLPLKTAFEDA